VVAISAFFRLAEAPSTGHYSNPPESAGSARESSDWPSVNEGLGPASLDEADFTGALPGPELYTGPEF
jgi:hypothetical protein